MGQHKTNPTAQLAKAGKLPPKPPKMSKREIERQIKAHILQRMVNPIFAAPKKEEENE